MTANVTHNIVMSVAGNKPAKQLTQATGEKVMAVFEELECTLTGTEAQLMHNGQLCDPLNPYAKSIKLISSKRKKTDDDFEEMSRKEWEAGLYLDEGRPCWPAENIHSMLIAAAKKQKEGPLAKAGLVIAGKFRLDYKGPKSVEKLWADPLFRLVKSVRVGTSRVMRTRPLFPSGWKLTVKLMFDPEQVNREQVEEWFEIAGARIGLSDWRPQYGRFSCEFA